MIKIHGISAWPSRGVWVLLGVLFTAASLYAQPAATQTFDLKGGQSLEVRLVRAGIFKQGSPDNEANRSDEEYQRAVRITKDFYLGTTEVTVGQFRQFVLDSNYRTESEKGDSGGFGWDGSKLVQRREFNWRHPGFPQTDQHPVTGVTYDDAMAFCTWLRQRTGQAFDLPTEAQWEYAARAGEDTPWPGSAEADEVAWHKGNSPLGTQPVGRLKPNAWGFQDLGGNAAEWCRDWYAAYGDGGAASLSDPWVSSPPVGDKPRRVLRGGSWLREAKHARVAARYRNDPKSRNADNGFRVYVPLRTTSAAAPTAPANASVGVPAASPNPSAGPRSPVAPPDRMNRRNQLTPVARPAVQPTSSNWIRGPLSWLCPLACVGTVVGLVYVMLRKLTKSTTPISTNTHAAVPQAATDHWIPARTLPPEAIFTELQADGFRMLLNGVALGELVRYSTMVAGQMLTDTVAYEPGGNGQFIYTGARPDSVTILGIATGSDQVLPGQTSIHDSGPGGHPTAGSWANFGGGSIPGAINPLSARPRRNPSAYE